MFEYLVILTGLVIGGGAFYAYRVTRDGFHPAVILAPPLGYAYVISPLLLNQHGGLEEVIDPSRLEFVASLYLVSILTFVAGLLQMPSPRQLRWSRGGTRMPSNLFAVTMTAQSRKRVASLALLLGLVAVAAYLSMLLNVGGFVQAYSRAKGGGYAASGYIGEARLLSFPALILLALARQGKKIRLADIALGLLFIAPHLLQGTFGGRRGPLFLALAALLLAWFIARGVRPSLKAGIAGLTVVGFAVLLVMSQRHSVYLGSGEGLDLERMENMFAVSEFESTDFETEDYVAGVAAVLKVKYEEKYYWGYRYLVTLFVRPIPRQIWPTKYEDVGADWIHETYMDQIPIYIEAVGFAPPSGSAIGFVADIFNEVGWGTPIVTFLFGASFAAVWRRHVLRGGLWTVLLVEMLILSVYIPTQSFSAWFHRFLVMGTVSWLAWRYWIERAPERRSEVRKTP